MKIHVVIDLVYGAEGSPGDTLFRTKEAADFEEARLLADDPQDGTYLVCRDICELEDI